jgi:hypothetical protein
MVKETCQGEVAVAFHWKVLLAVLRNELGIKHQAYGVDYKFQDLETFARKWWPAKDDVNESES